MRSLRQILVAAIFGMVLIVVVAKAEVNEFKLTDQFGVGHHVRPFGSSGYLLLVAINDRYLKKENASRLLTVIDKVKADREDLQVYLIYSAPKKNRSQLAKLYPRQLVLHDLSEVVSRSYGFNSSLDFVMLSKADFSLIQKGNLADTKKILSLFNKPQKLPHLESQSLRLLDLSKVSFQKEVIPALERTCLGCHSRFDSIDLFSSENAVHSWQAMMLKTIRLSLMPGGYDLHSLSLQRYYSMEDLRVVSSWLSTGAPMSSADGMYLQKYFADLRNHDVKELERRGKPDLELIVDEKVVVEPEAKPFVKIIQFPTKVLEDHYVEEIYLQTDTSVAHHVKLYATTEPMERVGNKVLRKDRVLEPVTGWLGERKVPGAAMDISHQIMEVSRASGFIAKYPCFDQHCYRSFIPAQSIMTLELHYRPSGKLVHDKPRVLIYFSKGPTDQLKKIKKLSLVPSPDYFSIAPKEGPISFRMKYQFPKSTKIMGFSLHAHLRALAGKMKLKATNEQNEVTLMAIPFFQYKLQNFGFLETPYLIRKGDWLETEVVYDNSENNESNPNPDTLVKIGENVQSDEAHGITLFLME